MLRGIGFLRGRRTLSLVTWNVWFGLEKPHHRWTELLRIVGSARPDVIAFQEVTDPFLEMLRKTSWVKRGYSVSDPKGESIDRYGAVIVTHLPPLSIEVHPLASEMERKLTVLEAEAGGMRWTFASVHLESLKESADVRGRQLQQVVQILSPFQHVVLMGDFNFCSSWTEENERIPGDYVDVWPSIRPDDGFTVDSEANEMRRRVKAHDRKRVRFDRILVRSDSAQPVKAKLLGTRKVRGVRPSLFPSDHFGVHAQLRIDPPAP